MSIVSRRATLSSLLVLASALLPAAGAPMEADPAQQRVLVFGDSQAQGLAAGLQRLYRADRERRVLDRSKISTGLSRPAYDWPAQAEVLATTERADVAIALFGANDRGTVRIGGRMDLGLLQRFAESYSARVASVVHAFRQAQVPLVWVGHPIVRDPAYAEDMALLNDIFAERTAAEGAAYLSTWDAFRGPDGAYAAYGRGTDGQTTRLRADDGVHMTPAGYDVMAAMLVPSIDQGRFPAAPRPTASRAPPQG